MMTTQTGWADDRLMDAFDLIEEVIARDDVSIDGDAFAALKRLRDQVEAVDEQLARELDA